MTKTKFLLNYYKFFLELEFKSIFINNYNNFNYFYYYYLLAYLLR